MQRTSLQAGFTILEALIAFTILAVFLALLYEVLRGGIGRTERARFAAEAALIAESQLDIVRARKIEPEWNVSKAIPGTRFSIAFVPGSLELPAGTGGGLLRPVRLTAVLAWNEAGARRTLSVHTVILAKRGRTG